MDTQDESQVKLCFSTLWRAAAGVRAIGGAIAEKNGNACDPGLGYALEILADSIEQAHDWLGKLTGQETEQALPATLDDLPERAGRG